MWIWGVELILAQKALISPYARTLLESIEKIKKRVFNSYDDYNYSDIRTENQLFLSCSQVYYQQCRDFYEKRM